MSYSEKVRRQRTLADKQWLERQEDRASMDPRAPLASKLFRNNTGLLSDAKRGAVSPLGGVAKSGERGRGR
jgi:hypothetical protein